MKIVKAMIGSLLLAALPLAAQAEEMSYSYIEAGYVSTDFDSFSESADGIGIRGSIGFAEYFFGFAEYSTQELEIGSVDVDVDQMSVGLGGRYGISDKVDLVGRIGYTEVDVSGGGSSADADGYLLSAGVRGQVTEDLELEGHVIHVDLGSQGGDDTALAVGGRYFFTENFAAGAEFQFGDDAETWILGVRFAF